MHFICLVFLSPSSSSVKKVPLLFSFCRWGKEVHWGEVIRKVSRSCSWARFKYGPLWLQCAPAHHCTSGPLAEQMVKLLISWKKLRSWSRFLSDRKVLSSQHCDRCRNSYGQVKVSLETQSGQFQHVPRLSRAVSHCGTRMGCLWPEKFLKKVLLF